jgi:chromatin assembly factor 1 subunit B
LPALRSCDGRALIISSTDGYCSIITFKPGELGVPVQNITPAVANSTTPETNAGVTISVPTVAVSTVVCPVVDEETEDIKLILEDTIDNIQQVKEIVAQESVEKMDIDDNDKPSVDKKIESPKVKSDVGSPLRGTGRRVQLITLSSPKKKKA